MANSHAARHDLPASLTPLVGRDGDIASLAHLLASKQSRLVTLTGPGGIGKTRLALAVAARGHPRFPDGVRFIELSTLTEPRFVALSVAVAFHVSDGTAAIPDDALLDTLQPMRALIVLDNCEHVISGCAALVEDILHRCPDISVIATSREPLRIEGEAVWQVRPLPTPAADHPATAEDVQRFPSVQLFVERARAADRHFQVTDDNADALAAICRHLDGVPLAIELAAARTRVLDVRQIAARLEDRLNLLTVGNRTAEPRHQTLRRAVEWSYELLDPQEQMLFYRLAVFAGEFSLEAAFAICADPGADRAILIEGLSRLIDTSLLQSEESADGQRYRMLETLRLFGRERLVTSGQSEAYYRLHARYFLALAEVAEPELWGPRLAVFLDHLDRESGNLRAVLRWSTGRGEAEIALRLCAALGRFWQVRGNPKEGLRWLDGALVWETGSKASTRARALDAACRLARDQGHYGKAVAYGEESLALREASGDVRGSARALGSLGIVAQFSGDYALAERLHTQSLDRYDAVDDREGSALTLLALATTAQQRGNHQQASTLCERGIALFKELGDKRGVAAALNNLGTILSDAGDLDVAESCYLESLQLFRELEDPAEIAACLFNLAGIFGQTRRLRENVSQILEALNLYRELQDVRRIAQCIDQLSRAVLAQGALAAGEGLRDIAERLRISRQTVEGGAPAWHRLMDHSPASVTEQATPSAPGTSPLDHAVSDVQRWADVLLQQANQPQGGASILTPRQVEVARLIAKGYSNRQIAQTLFIAERTADTHIEHIMRKLDLHSRTHIAIWASEAGI